MTFKPVAPHTFRGPGRPRDRQPAIILPPNISFIRIYFKIIIEKVGI